MKAKGMQNRRLLATTTFLALAAALLLVPLLALAQEGNGYDLGWHTVDGGGWTFSSGEGYTLGGTTGQPDAGLLTGEGYQLGGGFWGGGALLAAAYEVYLPLVVR